MQKKDTFDLQFQRVPSMAALAPGTWAEHHGPGNMKERKFGREVERKRGRARENISLRLFTQWPTFSN
jgi:hypothetical protein